MGLLAPHVEAGTKPVHLTLTRDRVRALKQVGMHRSPRTHAACRTPHAACTHTSPARMATPRASPAVCDTP